MENFSFLNTAHAAYYASLYDSYLQNPDAVEPSWRSFFQGYDFANASYEKGTDSVEVPEQVQKEFKVVDLINAYRTRGHLFTKTNPVRARRKYTPNLDIETFGLSKSDLDTIFNAGEILSLNPSSLKNIIAHLEAIYCDAIGIEYMYIRKPEEIKWWQNKLNKDDNHPKYTAETKKYILSKLNQAVTFEQFLQTKFVGQKRFSLEGGETLIPALGGMVRIAAEDYDVDEFVFGMAHRGRLNTLTNIFRKPVRELFNEFEGKDFEEVSFDGDVKYHLGATYKKTLINNKEVTLNLVPNPSHLETVGPIVQGIAKSEIESKYGGDSNKVLPILVHGDAAIAGQGVVYEVIQMSKLNGYATGGTIHIVINNQVGFTTNYLDARSSTYCTDVGKVTLSPVLHVNADDVEAVTHAVHLALDFRMRFKRDVFIDLLGYRKYGHNEGDEPRFTQPTLYKAIAKQPNPKDVYVKKLIAEGVIDEAYAKKITTDFKEMLATEHQKSKEDGISVVHPFMAEKWTSYVYNGYDDMFKPIDTSVTKEQLAGIVNTISNVPEGVKFLRKAERILKDRNRMFFETDRLDWSMGELLAYGSLMQEGFNVRLSGQDVERGTFSHRHAILRDENSEKRVNLLNKIPEVKGRSKIYNSLLSEYGVLGFEYGFAMANPNTLTIWEAQFGDFSNGAQIIFDQYISAAEDKWKQQNGIVILLPHGYEGQGAEHSSARIERYLQLCAVENMVLANCTTPANFFHLLRRQMKRNFRKPLIVFTPKSLLRHPVAVSSVKDFTDGSFQEIIDDAISPENVKQLVFCSGKFYYELIEARKKLDRNDIAFVRVEQLFPLDRKKIKTILAKYDKATRYMWAQEEPQNMGAWGHMLQHFTEVKLELASQKLNAAVASGSSMRFKKRHQVVIDKVFSKTR
ncbi:MAG: 2-oxoglutarate dehydrogenase E1 component [Flavobacteriaceae bacterium]|nr:2-oxoglutarate dehydrogenase E1 component [Flavobacteriaceae bacterium]